MLSERINIRTSDSHEIIDNITNQRINFARSITIGNHVWIAADVTILKGVNIGSNSIIGCGSIITSKKIEENSLVAGIPAKILRTDVSWER